MIEMGIIVALGLIVVYTRLGVQGKLWINSHPLLIDIAVFVLLNWLHWGSFAGTMVAASGALFCSIAIGITRKWHGFIEAGRYKRGWVDLKTK